MGSPLALADICMNWVVDEVTNKSNNSFAIYRYVDDLFLAFGNIKDLPKAFSLFNSVHKKIKFTQQLEIGNQFSFLDIHIIKSKCNIKTRIFRKPTNAGSKLIMSGRAIGFCVINKIQLLPCLIVHIAYYLILSFCC